MARMFRTRTGEEYGLPEEKYEKLKKDFPTKNVDAVLYDMRVKLNIKPYYTKRGMYTAIRKWLTNSKDVDKKYSAAHTPFKPEPAKKEPDKNGFAKAMEALKKMGVLKK